MGSADNSDTLIKDSLCEGQDKGISQTHFCPEGQESDKEEIRFVFVH